MKIDESIVNTCINGNTSSIHNCLGRSSFGIQLEQKNYVTGEFWQLNDASSLTFETGTSQKCATININKNMYFKSMDEQIIINLVHKDIRATSRSSFLMYFNEPGDQMISKENVMLEIQIGSTNRIHMTSKNVKQLSSSESKCSKSSPIGSIFEERNDKIACQYRCFIQTFYFACNFTAEYMHQHLVPKSWINQRAPSYNITKNKECYDKYNDKSYNSARFDLMTHCAHQCIEPCQKIVYMPSMQSTDYYIQTGKPHKTKIRLLIDSMLETTVIEQYKYSLEDLLANIGGGMGLMTGCSVLSILELIIAATIFCYDRLIKERD